MTLMAPVAAIRDWAGAHVHEILAARERTDGAGDRHERR
jgi:hypothetical protein